MHSINFLKETQQLKSKKSNILAPQSKFRLHSAATVPQHRYVTYRGEKRGKKHKNAKNMEV